MTRAAVVLGNHQNLADVAAGEAGSNRAYAATAEALVIAS
jgi:hypothetical protein